MNTFSQASRTRRFRYGSILVIVSIIALTGIYLTREDTLREREQLRTDYPVVRLLTREQHALGEERRKELQEQWKALSADEQDAVTDSLMSARNKVAQVIYGPYIFWITLTFGLLSLILSFVRFKSSSDRILEEMEHDSERHEE